MANKRISQLTNTITAFRTGDVIPVDGPSGTAKMSKDDLLKETAENALGSIHLLSDTASEADLVSDNYLALDGSAGTKKLPGDCVAPKSATETINKAADLKNAIFGISQTLSGGSKGHIVLAFPICKGVTYRITPSVNVGACYALDANDEGVSHRIEQITTGIYATQFFDYTAGVNADYISVYFSAAGSVKIESIGVNDLIESNPETAQLGFSKDITASGKGWVITVIKGRKDFTYKLFCNVPVGVSTVASIDNATDTSSSHRIETFISSLPTGNTLTFTPSVSFDYLAIYFANAGTCTLKLKYGVKDIYERVGVIENNTSFINENMRGAVAIASGSIIGSKYGFEKISIKEGRTYSLGLVPSADITNSNYITMKLARMSDDSTYVQVSAWMTADYPKLLAGNFYFFNFTAAEDVDDLKIGSYFNSASVDSAMSIQYYLTDVTDIVASSSNGENATNAGVFYPAFYADEIAQLKAGSDKVFVLVSDLHHAQTNFQRVCDVANAIGADAILNGGDFVSNVGTESLDWFNDIVNAQTIPILSVLGNHEAWTTSSPWVWQGAEDNYNLLMPTVVSQADVVQPTDASTLFKCYYYKDFGNIRIICIDGIDYNMTNAHHWDATQLSWFQSVLADAITNSKKVVVFNHYPYDKTKVTQKADAWNSWDSYLNNYKLFDDMYTPTSAVAAVKDFIDAGGVFVGWLTGHMHRDLSVTIDDDSRQYMMTTASGSYAKHTDSASFSDISQRQYDCFTLVGVDTTHGFIKFLRCGLDEDSTLAKRKPYTWDYVNRRFFKSN